MEQGKVKPIDKTVSIWSSLLLLLLYENSEPILVPMVATNKSTNKANYCMDNESNCTGYRKPNKHQPAQYIFIDRNRNYLSSNDTRPIINSILVGNRALRLWPYHKTILSTNKIFHLTRRFHFISIFIFTLIIELTYSTLTVHAAQSK